MTLQKIKTLIKEHGDNTYLHIEYQSKYDMKWYPITKTMLDEYVNGIERFGEHTSQIFLREKS